MQCRAVVHRNVDQGLPLRGAPLSWPRHPEGEERAREREGESSQWQGVEERKQPQEGGGERHRLAAPPFRAAKMWRDVLSPSTSTGRAAHHCAQPGRPDRPLHQYACTHHIIGHTSKVWPHTLACRATTDVAVVRCAVHDITGVRSGGSNTSGWAGLRATPARTRPGRGSYRRTCTRPPARRAPSTRGRAPRPTPSARPGGAAHRALSHHSHSVSRSRLPVHLIHVALIASRITGTRTYGRATGVQQRNKPGAGAAAARPPPPRTAAAAAVVAPGASPTTPPRPFPRRPPRCRRPTWSRGWKGQPPPPPLC
jgi:hypothetical protein